MNFKSFVTLSIAVGTLVSIGVVLYKSFKIDKDNSNSNENDEDKKEISPNLLEESIEKDHQEISNEKPLENDSVEVPSVEEVPLETTLVKAVKFEPEPSEVSSVNIAPNKETNVQAVQVEESRVKVAPIEDIDLEDAPIQDIDLEVALGDIPGKTAAPIEVSSEKGELNEYVQIDVSSVNVAPIEDTDLEHAPIEVSRIESAASVEEYVPVEVSPMKSAAIESIDIEEAPIEVSTTEPDAPIEVPTNEPVAPIEVLSSMGEFDEKEVEKEVYEEVAPVIKPMEKEVEFQIDSSKLVVNMQAIVIETKFKEPSSNDPPLVQLNDSTIPIEPLVTDIATNKIESNDQTQNDLAINESKSIGEKNEKQIDSVIINNSKAIQDIHSNVLQKQEEIKQLINHQFNSNNNSSDNIKKNQKLKAIKKYHNESHMCMNILLGIFRLIVVFFLMVCVGLIKQRLEEVNLISNYEKPT